MEDEETDIGFEPEKDWAALKKYRDSLPDLDYFDFRVQLVDNEKGDLEPEILEIPFEPRWWQYEDESWDYTLNGQWIDIPSGLGWSFQVKWMNWALEHGIASEQPFWLRMTRPDYTPDYYGEVDGDYDLYVLRIEPLPFAEALSRWDLFLSRQREYQERAKVAMASLLEKQRSDVGAMFIQSFHYGPDMHWGIGHRLCTKHVRVEGFVYSSWGMLAEGRDDKGDREVAFNRMVEESLQRFPQLTMERIQAMPRRW